MWGQPMEPAARIAAAVHVLKTCERNGRAALVCVRVGGVRGSMQGPLVMLCLPGQLKFFDVFKFDVQGGLSFALPATR